MSEKSESHKQPQRKDSKHELSGTDTTCEADRSSREGKLRLRSRNGGGAEARKTAPSARKNAKRTGEFSEAAFLVKATGLGFKVAKPWGDSERYDFVVACPDDPPEFFWRVQIKCTETARARAYEVRAAYTIGKGRAIYTADDIDFVIAHVVPRDIWYVVPVAACMLSPLLRFYPDGARRTRFEHYREAWDLLRRRPK